MWVLVLAPPLLRSRSEGRPSNSIGTFRRQLATLSRTSPGPRGVVAPMYRPGPWRGQAPVGPQYAYEQAYDPRYQRYDEDFWGPQVHRAPRQPEPPMAVARAPMPVRGYSVRPSRSLVKRRRQNVLFTLVAIVVLTAVLGFGMGNSAFMAINLMADALLAFYVYLLVQLRRAAEERAMRYAWSKAA
jgi:hypothetical protein